MQERVQGNAGLVGGEVQGVVCFEAEAEGAVDVAFPGEFDARMVRGRSG